MMKKRERKSSGMNYQPQRAASNEVNIADLELDDGLRSFLNRYDEMSAAEKERHLKANPPVIRKDYNGLRGENAA